MILDATFNEGYDYEDIEFDGNAFSEDTAFDEADLLCYIEQAYSNVMLEQVSDEFGSFVENGGIIEAVNEGFIEKAKNFIKKIWNKIKMYFKKFMNVLNRVFGNCYKFYKKRTAEINAGCNGVEAFKGYRGLKNFGTIGFIGTAVSGSAKFTRAIAPGADFDNIFAQVCKMISGHVDVKFFDRLVLNILRKSDQKETITYTPAEIANVLGSEVPSTVTANNLKSIEACLRDAQNTISAAKHQDSGTFALLKKIISIQNRAIMHCTKATKEVVSQANSYAHRAVSVAIANQHGYKEDYEYDNDDHSVNESDEAYDYLAQLGVVE